MQERFSIATVTTAYEQQYRRILGQIAPWLYGADYEINGPAQHWAETHGVADGVQEALALRAGFALLVEQTTAGVGFKAGRLQIDYAAAWQAALGCFIHRVKNLLE